MKKEDLALIRDGDLIHFTTKVLTPQGMQNGGIDAAEVIGKTEQSALIRSKQHPDLTIAVQAHHIVAVFRGNETVYIDIEQHADGEEPVLVPCPYCNGMHYKGQICPLHPR